MIAATTFSILPPHGIPPLDRAQPHDVAARERALQAFYALTAAVVNAHYCADYARRLGCAGFAGLAAAAARLMPLVRELEAEAARHVPAPEAA